VDELTGTPPEVSATDIRRRAAAGEPIVDLVPPEIAAYIAAHGLYRSETP
jgi:nicotinate-nucleotide adenylyltransferase